MQQSSHMQQSYGPLRVVHEGAIVRVTIDHPPTNLVDAAFIGGVIELLHDLDAAATGFNADSSDALRVVVFASADPDFFLMHGDVVGLGAMPERAPAAATEPNVAAATFQRLSSAPYVSIAKLDGAARGGGAEFLSAMDLRIGSPRSVLGQPEVPMGILPGAGGTSRLPRLLGRSRALEIMLTGRDVTADEALAIGWLTAVVPAEALDDHVDALAHRLAKMPAASIAAVKRVVDTSLGDLVDAMTAETDALGRLTAVGAQREPMRRFLAAGGQTRAGESSVAAMRASVDAMLD
jgi:enoyl-CoA hydratase/carnithine racemase